MDSFQGCYKNGTESGTRDCRWFLSVFFILRFLLFVIYGLTLNASFLPVTAFVLFLTALLIATVQPFKTSLPHYNFISTVLTQFFAFFILCLTGKVFSALYFKPKVQSFWLYLSLIFGTAPLGYVLICGLSRTGMLVVFWLRRFMIGGRAILECWSLMTASLIESIIQKIIPGIIA